MRAVRKLAWWCPSCRRTRVGPRCLACRLRRGDAESLSTPIVLSVNGKAGGVTLVLVTEREARFE